MLFRLHTVTAPSLPVLLVLLVLLAAVPVAAAPVIAAPQGPVISEIMAQNVVTLADEDGDTSDWIEVHNPAAASIQLGGWHLTDDAGDPKKWAFPTPTTLGAGAFLVVYASGKNRAVSSRPLHTNFRLSRNGEYVGLADSTGRVVSDFGPGFPKQFPDMSYGLEFNPGVTSKRTYFGRGTPFRANGLGAAIVGDVTHNPALLKPGTDCVVTAQLINPNRAVVNSVSMRHRTNFGAEATIAMRDDGRAPDLVANDGYWTAAIPGSQFSRGQMVRWRFGTSIQGGANATTPVFFSPVASPQYFGAMVEDPTVNTSMRTFYWWVEKPWLATTSTGTRCSVFFEGEFYDNVEVRTRGGSTQNYPKRSFKFDFNRGYQFSFDPNEARVDEANLNSTYSDKAFVRQILAHETFRDAGAENSVVFPVRQQQNGQFYMVSIYTEQVDDEYLARQKLDPDGALFKVYNSLDSFSMQRIEKKSNTPDGWNHIRTLITAINTPGPARDNYLWDQIDIPACINYWACIVLMHDNDSVHKNYYVFRDWQGDGEWRFLPWDKDLTFGRNYTNSVLNDTIWADRDPQSHPLYGDRSHRKIDNFYNRLVDVLLADSQIRAMYLRRLRTLMDRQLDDSSTMPSGRYYERRITTLQNLMQPDVALDKARWGVPAYGDPSLDFDKAVGVLVNTYLAKRRNHLFRTHSSSSTGIIPPKQPAFGLALGFGAIEVRPASNNVAEQFVEIVNSNSFAVDVSNWRLRGGGIEFAFEPGTVIAAGKSVFVTADATAFRNRKTGPSGGQKRFVVGPFAGSLTTSLGLALYDEKGFPMTQAGEFPYTLTTTGQGDAAIAVDKAAPSSHLWILFSGDNRGAPGSGPFLGLGVDVLWQIGLPLGTAPIHVLTDARGGYSWSAPNNTVPKNLTLTSRAAYLDANNRIVVSQVRRVTF